MDIRVLINFLAVAKEGNITRAAEMLHISQPALSRQLIELEEELGAELLVRGNRHVTLSASGILFQQRAQEIVTLLEKTQRDIADQYGAVGGMVSIGCVETSASRLLPDVLEEFGVRYPMVQYEIYSANGDDIRNKLDSGQLELGILVEPIEAAKYEYIRLPFQERWGVLMRKDDPLTKMESISIGDMVGLPLIVSQRQIVVDEMESWLGELSSNLRIVVYHNLMTNTLPLIERGLGYSVSVEGALTVRPHENICFVPFSPERSTGHVLAWKKKRIFGQAASLFLEYIRDTYQI